MREIEMRDLQRSHETAANGSAVSLLGRLDRIDLRLRELEEKQRRPESYFTADLRARCDSLPAALQDVQIKETLIDRLQLLEKRIRQLSLELDERSTAKELSLQRSKKKSNAKAEESMAGAIIDEREKGAASFCRHDQRTMNATSLCRRRWFTVGC